MKATPKSLAMASTHAGMRRILKKQLPPDEYIRKAVIAGVYKGSSDAYEDRHHPKLKKRTNRRTGAHVFEFPEEYEIMKLNPIYQDETRVTEKDRKKVRKWEMGSAGNREEEKRKSMDRYIKDYLRRNSLSTSTAVMMRQRKNDDSTSSDEYYTNLLGVAPPDPFSSKSSSFMAQKSILLDNAYNFALRQYDLRNKQDLRGNSKIVSEEESVRMVEDILKQEQLDERFKSRKVTDDIVDWRSKKEEERVEKKEAAAVEKTKEAKTEEEGSPSPASIPGIPSILHSKPHTITALTTWSKRLALLPYSQWSVGAVTALDHWIAVDVLGMDELTWQTVLEGQGVNDNLAFTRDIVDTRCALFPETTMPGDDEDEYEGGGEVFDVLDQEKEKKKKEVEQSIDELLASLGGFDEDDDDHELKKKDGEGYDLSADGTGESIMDNEELVEQMKLDLQQWRAKCEEDGPYESWEDGKKKEFDSWLEQYVRLLINEEWELEYVDFNETRETLLSSPPKTQDESDEYWNNLRDETQAEIFLQSILDAHKKDASATTTTDEGTATFLSLPYETQLKQLIHLGTLRPFYDEFMSESSKQQFIQQNIHTLLENVELEHLVYDPKGPITVDDIGAELLQGRELNKGARFRIELLKYGTDEYGTSRAERARALYRAWNEHKANRARYEEVMFKKGKIGLKAKRDGEE